MLLLSLLAAYVVVRLAEDLPAGIHGTTPPRHEYRMAKLRQAEQNGGKPLRRSAFGRYCSGVVDDAWNSAITRRQRMAGRRDERQQRRIDRKLRRAHARDERNDARITRHRERSEQRHQNHRAERQQRRQPVPATEPRQEPTPTGNPEREGDSTTPDDIGHGQQTAPAATPQPRTSKGAPVMSVPTGETNGLDSAISFAEQMKSYLTSAVTATEQSVANLSAGGVTGESLSSLASAQEQLSAAVQAFEAAEHELRGHLTVREAYDATPGAGDKEFLTAG